MKPLKKCVISVSIVLSSMQTFSQSNTISLADLSVFKNPASNWQILGDVSMDWNKPQDFSAKPGTGILLSKAGANAADLYTNFEHSDIDIEFEFMMARNSNSGVYLMGNYEIQLYDSWGKPFVTSQDCGAIYERWDDTKPEGQKGYLGLPPRENACKAPGLWQKMKISFDAPRFSNGKKIANARINYVYLNDVLLHENVELSGPTRGASGEEKSSGPLRIQGDHGVVAFRNIRYNSYSSETLSWSEPVKYTYYEQSFGDKFNVWDFKPKRSGTIPLITYEVSDLADKFAVVYEGKINVQKAGEYEMEFAQSGHVQLVVNNDTIIKSKFIVIWDGRIKVPVTLKKGENSIKISYWKNTSWAKSTFGAYITGQGVKKSPLHELNSQPPFPKSPAIAVVPNKSVIVQRTFMDDVFNKIHPHSASIGFPAGLNATIDTELFTILQIWKGGFLDMVNAWEGRGGQPVQPLGGPVLKFAPVPSVALLPSSNSPWPDSLSPDDKKNTILKSYYIDEQSVPHFNYQKSGVDYEETFSPDDNNKLLTRSIKAKGNNIPSNMYFIAAQASKIEQLKDGSYMVGDKQYIIKPKPGTKMILRDSKIGKELIMPLAATNGLAQAAYSYLW